MLVIGFKPTFASKNKNQPHSRLVFLSGMGRNRSGQLINRTSG